MAWHCSWASCLVILGTVYTLSLPATTMSTDTFCGLEEHVHSEECYEQILACENADPAELSVHMHSDDCYEVQRELVCTQEMNEDGTEHEHTDECYQDEPVLVCPIEETAENESAEHIHSEECYAMELICEKQEHTHTLQCHSNPYAVENSDLWTQGIPTLSGKPVQDLVATAESQLGYTESTENFRVNEDGSLSGYTRYGAWYGGANDSDFAYGDWCASFVSFCLNYAGIPQSDFPYSAGCEDWTAHLTERGLYEEAANHTPQAGDIVFLNMNGYGADHVGIVTDADENTVYTIEGNLNSSVARSSHSLIGGEILGYGILPDNQAEDMEDPENDAQISTVGDAHETIEISVSTRQSTYHDPKATEDGTLLYYTGESAVTTLNISNPTSTVADDGAVVRLYMKFEKTEPGTGIASTEGAPTMKPGSYTVNAPSGAEYAYTVTEVADSIYCFEIQRPINGDTISLDLPSGYPSPASAGGTNEIWAVVLTKEEKDLLDQNAAGTIGIAPKPSDGSNQQTFQWDTKADNFALRKTLYSKGNIKTDGSGSTPYVSGQYWNVTFQRDGATNESIGKDLLSKVDITDTPDLPEGVQWNPAVLEAIRENQYEIITTRSSSAYTVAFQTSAGMKLFHFVLSRDSYQMIAGSGSDQEERLKENLQLQVTEDGKLTFHLHGENTHFDYLGNPVYSSTEMDAFGFSLSIADHVLEIPAPEEGKEYVFHNVAASREYPCWSAAREREASAEANVTVGEASMQLKKTSHNTDQPYWGIPVTHSITASNPGVLTYKELGFIEDPLPKDYYLDTDSYTDIFSRPGKATITISNATLCAQTENTKWTDVSGTAHTGIINSNYTTPDTNPDKYHGMQSTDPSVLQTDAVITITKDEQTGLAHIVCNGITIDCQINDIEENLNALGLCITLQTQYHILWDLRDENGEAYSLAGGEELSFDFRAKVKDTFMRLSEDTETMLPAVSDNVYADGYMTLGRNYAYAYGVKKDADGNSVKGDRISYSAGDTIRGYPEMKLEKSATAFDGSELTQIPANGQILNYTLRARCMGSQYSKMLPITDHMSGAQVLLAEVEKNSDADWAANCEIITAEDGKQYYKLVAPGVYHNVWISGCCADSVTVKESDTGRDTLIKWYSSPRSTKYIKYHALVCPNEVASNSLRYSIGNESWLNDHETHRLYASIPDMEGTVSQFNKRIVSEADMLAAAKEPGQTESIVGEGESVYYRFCFMPSEDGKPYTISGKMLRDDLPLGLTQDGEDILRWRASSTPDPGSVWIAGYEGYQSIQNPESYSVTEANANNQQSICWGDDFSITVQNQPTYVYVRLVFPKGAAWHQYAAMYASTELANTLYVDGVPDSVTHTLKNTASAYLQKGVYYTNNYTRGSAYAYSISNQDPESLYIYSNDSASRGAVTYYAVLYNAGSTRLYVQDFQDVLPEGFSLMWLTDVSGSATSFYWRNNYTKKTTFDFSKAFVEMPSGENPVTWVHFDLSATADSGNPQKLTFHVSDYSGTSSGAKIHYDDARGMYYLEPGEGLNFGYVCMTNQREDTQDVALNSIAMPYYDFNQSGVTVSDSDFTRKPRTSDESYLANDGDCRIMDNSGAAALGFSGGEQDTQWLESSVSVRRGGIHPGITKVLTSATSTNGIVTKSPIAAHPTDSLQWSVTAENDGNMPIIDYVLSDTMQTPYWFNGNVRYQIYASSGRTLGYENLFRVSMTDEETAKLQPSSGGFSSTLKVNGDAVRMSTNWDSGNSIVRTEYFVKLTKSAESGAYTLSLRFEDDVFGIPAGGKGVLTLETEKATTSLENKVFINTCFITPMTQVWDGTTNKGNMTDMDAWGDGTRPSVRNSAPVTTSYGYATGSLKSVHQTDAPENYAASNDAQNYIVLPDKETEFTYTLTVENSDKAMRNIILIDGLPYVGDHSAFQTDDPRYSKFRVRFADTPNVCVTVQTEDGTKMQLDSSQFSAEFSGKTEFEKEDWNGTSDWSKRAENARAVRIRIADESGTLIPAKSTLSVSFNAVIDGEAAPGQIAWNSFGYHYSIVGNSAELEAAPLKVGVMLPTVPKIQKTLTGNDGAAVSAVQDETFRFLCYTGTSLKITEESQLGEALNAANRKATLIELKVPAGSSVSELATLLDCVVWDYTDNGWVKTEEPWSWTDQAQYTLVELPSKESLYLFGSINKSATATGYSFYYRSGEQLTLSAVNILDTWNFTIRKVDADDASPLNGAWFALYSPNEEDKLTQEAYEAIMAVPHQKPAETVEYDGRTWYLTQVGQSQAQNGTDGMLRWDGLFRDEYLYCEVQAPQGHALDGTIHLARKDDSVHSITITNEKSGYELPQTGGIGTIPFYLAGAVLLMTAGMLYFRKKEKQI